MEPQIEGGTSDLRKDVITFEGLPTPESGNYIIHIGDNEYTTGIRHVSISTQLQDCFYDIQGRKQNSQPSKGIYIINGQKVYAK